jgi:ribosomal protein L30E
MAFCIFIAGAYPQDTRASIKTIAKSNTQIYYYSGQVVQFPQDNASETTGVH